ncbi:hypothetical protein SDC9_203708 [bioreactor metagenome]|uniref:Type II secretion system protein E n=1 Tax=bioreactor metagenome TaxID=1076179 RepID=A0A645J938_9ZZZZ
MQKMIADGASIDQLKQHAGEMKMRLLRDEVLDLIKNGMTTVEEGIRILYSID